MYIRVRVFLMTVLTVLCTVIPLHAAVLNGSYEVLTGFSEPKPLASEVRIAVIDTGIETERLPAGCVADGQNYVWEQTGDPGTHDRVGHGTAIASLIVGADDGTDTLTALAPGATLIPLVYYSEYASGVPINGGVELLSKSIYDAVDIYAADILVISSGIAEDDLRLRDAVRYAEQAGVTVIAAAGNDGDGTPYYPAAYPTVIGVGAVDTNGSPAAFSQKSGHAAVMAPGVALRGVSVKNSRFYEAFSGTSYSCAYVAALAAQLKGAHPDMTPAQFRWVLANTAADIGMPGYDDASGYGIIRLDKALAEYEVLAAMPALPFRDVRIGDWYSDAVTALYADGVIRAENEDTYFLPAENCPRVSFATFLYRMEGCPPTEHRSAFTDLPETGESMNAVHSVNAVHFTNAAGLLLGVSETEFAPDAPLTREQAAVILYRYAGYKGYPVSEYEYTDTALNEFADEDEIGAYAESAMQWAVAAGLLCGRPGNLLAPLAAVTNAEAAVIFDRFLNMGMT